MVGCILRPALRFARISIASATLLSAWMLARADVTTEGAYRVFRPGGDGAPFLTASWSFTLPRLELEPRLLFDFGFATDETLVPQVFGDSFTVTVQAADESATAILLTADRFGVAWAPTSPGALAVDPAAIQHLPADFPALTPALVASEAYVVDYRLPVALAGREVMVYGDFFDNANGVASLAYVAAIQIASLPDTAPLTNLVLESSAAAAGPYAVESEAVADPVEGRFLLPLGPDRRFYRLSSDLRLRITQVETGPGHTLRLRYAVEPADLVVEEATDVTGPYTLVPILGFDGDDQAVWLPQPASPRFYRVKSATPLRLADPRSENGRLKLPYLATPATLGLLSSAQVTGPYAAETGFSRDPATRWVTLPRGGMNRFFRVRANAVSRITRMTIYPGQDQIEFIYGRP